MSELVKINNIKVRPLKASAEVERKKQKGKALFSLWCPSVYLLATTGGGKTTVANEIIKQLGGKYTKYIIIAPTVDIDPSYKALVKRLGENCITYTDLKDDNGANVIEQFLKEQDPNHFVDSDEEDDEEGQVGGGFINVPLNNFRKNQIDTVIQQQTGKGKKEEIEEEDDENTWTYSYPKYIIIMDDLGDSMRNKWVTQLLKTNRHYNTMVIASSQDYNDLNKAARKQPRYVFVFPGMAVDKLKELHKDLNLSITFDDFLDKYKKATAEKYNFLYIGRLPSGTEYRKNFDKKFK